MTATTTKATARASSPPCGRGLPALTDRVVARIRAEIPFYAGQDVVAADDLRASVRANIDYILDSLTGTATANLSAPNATGRTRAAQGAPLAEMLTAYRVGVAELWSALVATARDLPDVPAGDVIDLAGDGLRGAEHLQRRRARRLPRRGPGDAPHPGAGAGRPGRGDPHRRHGEGHPVGGGQRPAAAARRRVPGDRGGDGTGSRPDAARGVGARGARRPVGLAARRRAVARRALPARPRAQRRRARRARQARDRAGRRQPGVRRAAPGRLGARARPAGARQPARRPPG